jgi:hypothetical protein
MAQKDYYLILGVPCTETIRGIQKAFRDLAKKYHPDRVGSQGTAAFQDIVEAYQILSDPERRRLYNQSLFPVEAVETIAPDPLMHRPPVEPLVPTSPRGRPWTGVEPLVAEPISMFHDFVTATPSWEALQARIFRNFTGLGVPKSEQAAGLNVEILLSPAEARRGGMIRLRIPVLSLCSFCAGTGQNWLTSCLACMGQGMIEREETIAVRIPPGVPSGTVLETPLSQVGITNFYLRVHIHTTD